MDISFTKEVQVPVGTTKLAELKINEFLIINIGEPAPQFTATTLDDKELQLDKLKGKVVLLDFWATWCGPCVAEFPHIKKAIDKYGKNEQFVVIGISVDDNAETVRSFIKKNAVNWTQIAAGPADTNPVAKKYHVTGVPATFLIDKDGKIVAKDLRGRALDYHLRQLLPEADHKPEDTAKGDNQ